MLGAIREIRPRWVVGENVPGIIDWSEGLVFEQVCSDMENEGYEVQPFVLPACGVDAPHRRDRVWFVAHRADSGSEDMCQGKTVFMPMRLLHTPTANDARNVSLPPSQAKRDGGMVKTAMRSDEYRTGAGFRLNPRFLAEMMGFPPDWTELPFLHGAGNPSKPTATP